MGTMSTTTNTPLGKAVRAVQARIEDLEMQGKRAKIAEYFGWATKSIHDPVPDYFGSLDAMADAERAIPKDKWLDYYRALDSITNRLNDKYWGDTRKMGTVFATAAQRAEAFGKTLDLW